MSSAPIPVRDRAPTIPDSHAVFVDAFATTFVLCTNNVPVPISAARCTKALNWVRFRS
ncbi:MAG: hypothetical protein GX456_16070 [Verrucomicrobia bacterium]|nr:hypothetical protein [Verrucomicrobiota bacterium]